MVDFRDLYFLCDDTRVIIYYDEFILYFKQVYSFRSLLFRETVDKTFVFCFIVR